MERAKERHWRESRDESILKKFPKPSKGERDLQDENRALAIPGGFQVDKEIAMSFGQLSQENRSNLLDHENIELVPMPSTSQENSNATAKLISIENIEANGDDDKEEEKTNDFLDQGSMEQLPMPSTSQENSNAAAKLISTENIEANGDDDKEEENMNDFLDQGSMEQLPMPSTSQGKSNASATLKSSENIDDDEEEADSFTNKMLFSFAWQIAKGMNHLGEKGFIHRDLAARNILVGSDNRVKVSDFGLMREICEDVYSGKNTKKLPVKWMAPESINDSIYTIKSDVWSFGILLWEMATMGGVPYPTLTNLQLCQLLKTGYRMERPDMCCDEVYELMSECWNEDPSSRPSFSELIDQLEVIMTRDVPYCDLNKHDESRP